MRSLGTMHYRRALALAMSGDPYTLLLTTPGSSAGRGKLPTTQMPTLGPDEVLIRVLYTDDIVGTADLVETTGDIATANTEFDEANTRLASTHTGGLDDVPAAIQGWFITTRTAMETDFPDAA